MLPICVRWMAWQLLDDSGTGGFTGNWQTLLARPHWDVFCASSASLYSFLGNIVRSTFLEKKKKKLIFASWQYNVFLGKKQQKIAAYVLQAFVIYLMLEACRNLPPSIETIDEKKGFLFFLFWKAGLLYFPEKSVNCTKTSTKSRIHCCICAKKIS